MALMSLSDREGPSRSALYSKDILRHAAQGKARMCCRVHLSRHLADLGVLGEEDHIENSII